MNDVALLTDPHQVHLLICGKPRSPGWSKKEREYKAAHPQCSACGTKSNLQVHHKKPYHLFPKLELVDSNLMTVCQFCHFVLCHENNWANYVVDVVARVTEHLQRVQKHKHKLIQMYGTVGLELMMNGVECVRRADSEWGMVEINCV